VHFVAVRIADLEPSQFTSSVLKTGVASPDKIDTI
jgi:hypothetical protein